MPPQNHKYALDSLESPDRQFSSKAIDGYFGKELTIDLP